MSGLLKSDFKRIRRDKLFLVLCILCFVFSLLTPLLYKIISSVAPSDVADMLGSAYYAKSMLFAAFSPANNFGLILPILITIVLYKDFSFGTIRNKIIGGKSRTSIFLSMFISCAVTMCIMILLHGLLSLGFGLMFFKYQENAFAFSDAVYLIGSLGLEMLVYIFLAALTSFICVFAKNTGLAIILSIAFNMALSLISSILQVALQFLSDSNGIFAKILKTIQNLNIYNFASVIGFTDKYTAENLLYLIITPLFFTAFLVFFGIIIMKKKDIK